MLNSHSSTKRNVRVNGKVIGVLEGRRFTKTVVGSRHKLRQPEAWAVDAGAFDTEISSHANEIVVVDREAQIEYRVPTSVFIEHSGEMDRGYGRQYFLTLPYWRAVNVGQLPLLGGE